MDRLGAKSSDNVTCAGFAMREPLLLLRTWTTFDLGNTELNVPWYSRVVIRLRVGSLLIENRITYVHRGVMWLRASGP